MKGTMLYGPRDIRFETLPDPTIIKPTDAIIRLAATCVCGSDLWPYRGIEDVDGPSPMGHEYAGIVEETGPDVRTVKPASSWSARSSPPTTPARSARRAIRVAACRRSPSVPSARRRPYCACLLRTARWYRQSTFLPKSGSQVCLRSLTFWGLVGLRRTPRM